MYMLDHDNIVKLFSHFEDKNRVYLIMECTEGGEVYDKLVKTPGNRFKQEQVKKYIR